MLKHLWNLLRHPIARVTGISFFINGFVFGSWAACIPYIKDKFNLDEASLGLMLLCMPVGVLAINPLTVVIMRRYGLNRVLFITSLLIGFAFSLPVGSPSLWFTGVGLVMAGCVFANQNVAMNTFASNVEQYSKIRLMSASHGMWSLGAMSGALLESTLVGAFSHWSIPIPPQLLYFLIISSVAALVMLCFRSQMYKGVEPPQQEDKKESSILSIFRPTGTLLLLASILICTYFTEGTMADWSAVYMSDIILAPETMAGWGYATYAGFMAGGRFIGDELIRRFTNLVVLRFGGILVLFGMVWIILSNDAWLVLPGFLLIGLGISLASPILYAASARVAGLQPGVGLATMNSFGMVAFLGGPVLVGFIAKAFDLRLAFVLVVITALFWVFQTNRLIRKKMII